MAILPWLGNVVSAAGNIIGGLIDKDAREDEGHQNRILQEDFARNGLRWKVEDARAAGIHPLYALGASTHSYSPVQVGSTLGESFSRAGQDVSRALAATATQQEREQMAIRQAELDSMTRATHAVQLEGLQLENEMRRLQIRRELGQVGPPFPATVDPPRSFPVRQGDVESRSLQGLVDLKRSEQTSRDPGVAGREASIGGGKPGFVPYRIGGNKIGFTLDVPSSDFGEGIEGAGPAAWLLGALGIGGHYGSRFTEWLDESLTNWSREWLRRNPKGNYPAVHPRSRR